MESIRKRILVIEDESSIRDLYLHIFQDDVELTFATDGQAGFRRAVQEDFDLIIVDLMMAPWNGAEALAAIEMIKPQTRFLVVSGYLGDESFDGILRESKNIVGTLSKPFEILELRGLVLASLQPQTA